MILKGAAAAVYYPDPAGRAMGDVDFLVPRERYEDALHLMTEQGYRQFSEGERHAEFMKDGVEFELPVCPAPVRDPEAAGLREESLRAAAKARRVLNKAAISPGS